MGNFPSDQGVLSDADDAAFGNERQHSRSMFMHRYLGRFFEPINETWPVAGERTPRRSFSDYNMSSPIFSVTIDVIDPPGEETASPRRNQRLNMAAVPAMEPPVMETPAHHSRRRATNRINNTNGRSDDLPLPSNNTNSNNNAVLPAREEAPQDRRVSTRSSTRRRQLVSRRSLRTHLAAIRQPSPSATINGQPLNESLGREPEAPRLAPGNNCVNNHVMCPVCMECALKRLPTSTKCGHIFCSVCIREAIRLTRKCPICKKRVSLSSLIRLYV